jgi:hypothetical protein
MLDMQYYIPFHTCVIVDTYSNQTWRKRTMMMHPQVDDELKSFHVQSQTRIPVLIKVRDNVKKERG